MELIFKAAFQEVIDVLEYNNDNTDQIFDKMDKENEGQTSMIRLISWFMSVLGHYLLFSPFIALLNWIPFVGFLLAGVLAVAAIIFSLVWATFLHFLILAISWVFYRPLFGAAMLVGVGLMIGIMCYS